MKKRIVSLLLIAAMMISLIPSTILDASAASTPQPIISVEDVWAAAGSTVEVNVTVSGNPGIYGATLTISWAEGLELVDAESGDVFKGLSYQEPSRYVSSGTNFIWYGTSVREIQDGIALKLTFQVAETVEESAILAINVSGNGLTDANNNALFASFLNGGVRIVNYIPGDTDGNRELDPRDLVALAKYISDNCTTDPDGFNISINVNAADVNDDGELNPMDLVLIAKYISDGCKTDPEGYNVILKPSFSKCTHNMQAKDAKTPSCTEDGNIAYWYCANCAKYFSDADATTEIAYIDTVISATGHTTVVDEAVNPSCFETGLTEGSHCSVCNEVLVAQVEVGKINHTPGVQATCTEDQVCTVCREVLATANGHIPGVEASCTEPQRCTVCQTALVEATGHSLTYVAEQDPVGGKEAADCVPGNCAYWQCSACSKCYLDENATQEIALADTAWETYLVYFFDLENDTYTVGAYKQSEVLSLKNISPEDMRGWDFNGWHTSENFSEQNKISVIPAGNTQNLNLYANRSLHEYKITLLGLGRNESLTYNVQNGIMLTTPTWMKADVGGDCLIFSHWSDENGEKITNIPSGEIGDRTIEANWIYKENYAVSNPDKYTYIGGYQNESGTYSFIYEIGAIKNLVLSIQHYYPFDGISEYSVADAQGYVVGNSQGMEVAHTISQIISTSTVMAEIEKNTTTHTEGWEVGGKIKPEVEYAGIKASIIEISGGYSNVDGRNVETTDFTSENNYEENGIEDELRSTVDYYSETSASRTITEKLIPGVSPIGNYTWARMMNVKVYAIVTYNPYTGNYVFDIYSEPTEVYNGLLYTLPAELEHEVNIVSGDTLDFDIPFASIPEMFYTVEYDANGGTGEMPKSVHELGVSSSLFRNQFERIGYTFVGWTTSADGTGTLYTDEFSVRDIATAGETVKLFAHWMQNAYTVEYHANGGTGSMEPSEHIYDEEKKLSANQFYRSGYTFLGWNTKGNATSVEYADQASVKNLSIDSAGVTSLYAVWGANVTLDSNGGTSSANSIILTADGKYQGLPETVSCLNDNYVFGGWYYGSTKITNGMNAVIKVPHALTAKWVLVVWSGSTNLDAQWILLGWEETKTTDLSKSDLISVGYDTLSITMSVYGKPNIDNLLFPADNKPFVEIYDESGNNVITVNLDTFRTDYITNQTVTFSIPTSTLLPENEVWVRFGSDRQPWYLYGYEITITASK